MSYIGPSEYMHDVANGEITNRSIWNKFGYNSDVDTGSTEVVASFGGAWGPNDIMITASTLTITYNATTDGAGSGTTGATQLLIDYIDANNVLQQAVHVLGSSGSDTTAFTCLGVNRAVVIANNGAFWNVNDITFTDSSSGGSVQAQIPAENSVTQQLIFHTPINYNFLLDWIWFNCNKISAGGSPVVQIIAYSYSRVTDTLYEIFHSAIDTGIDEFLEVKPHEPFIIGGREVLIFDAETDTNNTLVRGRFSGEMRPAP